MVAPNRNDRAPRPSRLAGDFAWPQRSRNQPWRTSIPAARRSAASACGIWRKPAGSSGRQARQAATSQAVTTRSSGPQRRPYSVARTRAAARSPATASRRRRGRQAGERRQHRPQRRVQDVPRELAGRAGRRWTGPSGASIAATYASNARDRREAGRPGSRTPGRSAASRRNSARGASREQRLEPGVGDDDRRVDERRVDPQRELGVAGAVGGPVIVRWSSFRRRISARAAVAVP